MPYQCAQCAGNRDLVMVWKVSEDARHKGPIKI